MTSPLNGGDPNKVDLPLLHINFQVQPGPDGQPWCAVEFTQGLAKAIFLVPEMLIEAWRNDLPKTLEELLILMRRAKSGLVVANPEDLKHIKKIKGGEGI